MTHLAIDNRLGQVKFANHAERNGAPTGFGVIELALKDPGLNPGLGQHFSRTGTTGSATHHCHTQHLKTAPPGRMLL